MAIAVNGGHVSRAIDFFDRKNKYFIIGGSTPWTNEPEPDLPVVEDFKLVDVIGLKRVDNIYLVVPDDVNGTIVYRSQKWRIVAKEINTVIGSGGLINGSNYIPVESIAGFIVGDKVRINNMYEAIITDISATAITVDTPAPATIPAGSPILGGAMVSGAKYVYVEGYLEYDLFPIETYRQIGLCTGVVPADPDDANILASKAYSATGADEYKSLGILEVLDNRSPIPRDINMRELISMILEF